MKIGILNGGGDCPGLNAVTEAVLRAAIHYNHDVWGIHKGWEGLLDPLPLIELKEKDVDLLRVHGGSILCTSRTNPYKNKTGPKRLVENFKNLDLDALIVVGGDDTLGAARKLYRDFKLNIIGVPKTIDNDLSATDYTFGFDTAVENARDVVLKCHETAEATERVIFVEVMGRESGWIAMETGKCGCAHLTLIPEFPMPTEEVCDRVKAIYQKHGYGIVVVAEGFPMMIDSKDDPKIGEIDEFGHPKLGGVGEFLADVVKKNTGISSRVQIVGYVQRAGIPTAFDIRLSTHFGLKAVSLVNKKKFGRMVALRGNKFTDAPLAEAVSKSKKVDKKRWKQAQILFY